MMWLLWWLCGKGPICNEGDAAGAQGSIPRLGRSPGGYGNPL